MHVLHVMESTIGGTRRHIVDATRGLAERGVDVTLVASLEREPRFAADLERLRAAGVRTIELGMVRSIRPGKDARHLAALEGILRHERPDVVHTHSSKAGVLGRLASLATGVGARVHTPHTFAFLFDAMFGRVQRGIFRRIEATLAASTDRVVAVSASEAETFRASGVVPPERVSVVANGIDPSPWERAVPVERAALGVPEGAPLLSVVGLLNVAKGQDLAIRALAEPALGQAVLCVVGDGETAYELAALARSAGVADRVRLLGWRDDVPGILAASDAVLVPSRWEALPYVALEAMAAGRPVVATRVDGAREVVVDGSTGVHVDVGDPRALASGAARVLGMPREAREAMGLRGRARVRERYGLAGMIDGLRAVYEGVAR